MDEQSTELRALLNELEGETFEVCDVADVSVELASCISTNVSGVPACSSSCACSTSCSSCA